ncbi:MAG: hypothetical protein LBQ60_22045 [Bacteroidales bacterium]|jgi:hypothetical protein|nr:hypothetical protein [Bacteroidales bacterium]
MKKNFFSFVGVVAIIAAVVFNVNLGIGTSFLPNLDLTNVEALAQTEGGGVLVKKGYNMESRAVQVGYIVVDGKTWPLYQSYNCCMSNPSKSCDFAHHQAGCEDAI